MKDRSRKLLLVSMNTKNWNCNNSSLKKTSKINWYCNMGKHLINLHVWNSYFKTTLTWHWIYNKSENKHILVNLPLLWRSITTGFGILCSNLRAACYKQNFIIRYTMNPWYCSILLDSLVNNHHLPSNLDVQNMARHKISQKYP